MEALIDNKSYIEDFSGPSPRAKKLAEGNIYDAKAWQYGIEKIGEKMTVTAYEMDKRVHCGFVRAIDAYFDIMNRGNDE